MENQPRKKNKNKKESKADNCEKTPSLLPLPSGFISPLGQRYGIMGGDWASKEQVEKRLLSLLRRISLKKDLAEEGSR
jgi:hypothetical protein